MILGIWGFVKVINSTKINSNAQKAQQTNLMWLLTSVVIIFFIPTVERINLVYLMPSLIYFTLNLFYLFKPYWQKEMLIIFIFFAMIFSLSNEWNEVGHQRILTQKLKIRNEKLMVLGPQIEEYQNNQMTGPFVNWELSKSLFTNLNQYKTIIMMHEYFAKDMPTYIYDPENNFKKLGYYLPELTNQYSLIEAHLYKKISNR
jgi:membrane-associated HD superfamily phosphohydrolase